MDYVIFSENETAPLQNIPVKPVGNRTHSPEHVFQCSRERCFTAHNVVADSICCRDLGCSNRAIRRWHPTTIDLRAPKLKNQKVPMQYSLQSAPRVVPLLLTSSSPGWHVAKYSASCCASSLRQRSTFGVARGTDASERTQVKRRPAPPRQRTPALAVSITL